MVIVGIAVIIGVIFPFTKCQENSIFFLYYFPVFLMGVILSMVDLSLLKDIKENLIYDVIAIIIVIGFIIAIPGVRHMIFGIEADGYLQNKYIFIGGAWAVFLFCVSKSRYIKNIFEKDKIFVWIGKISFPLYLIHYFVLQYMIKIGVNEGTRLVGTFVISLVLAWLMNFLIEKPLIKIKDKIDNLYNSKEKSN